MFVVPEDESIEEPALFYEENARNDKGAFHLRQNWSHWMLDVDPGDVSKALILKFARRAMVTRNER